MCIQYPSSNTLVCSIRFASGCYANDQDPLFGFSIYHTIFANSQFEQSFIPTFQSFAFTRILTENFLDLIQ